VPIPSAVANAGNNSSAQNVYRIVFSQNLATVPTLESWDDGTFSTTNRQQFTGTAGNGLIPMLSAIATTDTAPVSNWKPTSAVAGGAVANRMLGSTNFVNLSVGVPVAGGAVRFNLDFECPFDATVPSINTFGVLACRFAFSGATPTLTWQYNDTGSGGTEGSPSWTTITPGSAGNYIRPADSSASVGNVVLTLPSSGVLDSGSQWVTNT
jgi:hypothetical protein